MADYIAIGVDVMKYGSIIGGSLLAGAYGIGRWFPKKANGHAKCNEHSQLMTLSIESNTILKEMKKDNKEDHDILFDKIKDLNKDVNKIKVKNAFNEGKAVTGKKKHSKELKPFICLVIDDMLFAADATARMLEDYLPDKIRCTHVTSVDEAEKALKLQQFDLCFIDYYLNSSQNGEEVYNYFQKAYPKMKCLIYSGQHPDSISPEIKDIFLLKPFNPEEVIGKINTIFRENA
ncbi:MAG: response regulator [bacterium]|nr:response regulator [bacterium]